MNVHHFKGYGIPRFQKFFTHTVKPDEKQFHHVSDCQSAKQNYLKTTIHQIVIQTNNTLKPSINLTDEIRNHAINMNISNA